jgi:hypothetical protein
VKQGLQKAMRYRISGVALAVSVLGLVLAGCEVSSPGALSAVSERGTATPGIAPESGGSFTFTAAGDHWIGPQADASIEVVAGSGSAFYLALGDLSYTPHGEQAWCERFKASFDHVELIAGNHDTGEHAGGAIDTYVQHCPFTLGNLTGDYGKQYFFDYPADAPLARFIMISPGVRGTLNIDYSREGSGYVFTRDAIDGARAAGVPWVIVGMHKNCISVGAHPCEVGTDIMSLLIERRVDLILQSHDHNYQRSHQLGCITIDSVDPGCIVDDGADGDYPSGNGPIIVINGEFGRPLYGVSSKDLEAGYIAVAGSTTWGITRYAVSATAVTGEYLRSSGEGFTDRFAIRAAPAE